MQSHVERRVYAPKTVGVLRSFLQGLQGFPTVVHELLQNAEDAGAAEFYLRFTPEALWVGNDESFTEENFVNLASPAAASKRYQADKIGSFGIGFTSVYQLTDAPQVMSRGEQHTLLPLEDGVDVQYGVQHAWATTIRLPWAFTKTALREELDTDPIRAEQFPTFIEEAKQALLASAVFLNSVQRLYIFEGDLLIEEILVSAVDEVRTLTSKHQEQAYIIYETSVDAPELQPLIESGSRDRTVQIAVPLNVPDDFDGRFYAYLPTQESTLLPFHLNADFYPQADRKSLMWDGNDSTKQRWNQAVLEAAKEILPFILSGLQNEEKAMLYSFAEACLEARGIVGKAKTASWVIGCAAVVQESFETQPLLSDEMGRRVTSQVLLLPEGDAAIRRWFKRRIESRTPWCFPSNSDVLEFTPFFEKLGVQRLTAGLFIGMLPELFKGTDDIENGLDALDTVKPALRYLQKTLLNHEWRPGEKKILQSLPFAVNAENQLDCLNDVWFVDDAWQAAAHDWWPQEAFLSPAWMKLVGDELLALADHLTPKELLRQMHHWDAENVTAPLQDSGVRQRLLEFLSSQDISQQDVGGLKIFYGQDGSLHSVDEIVLDGEVKDGFGLVAVIDPQIAQRFSNLFHAVNVHPLDADRYYTKMLPQFFKENAERRFEVLRHLANAHLLTAERKQVWHDLKCVPTRDGHWVEPGSATFEHPLLEHLFKGQYDPVAKQASQDSAINAFLKALGVQDTPTEDKLVELVSGRAHDPVDDSNMQLREALLRHALGHPEFLRKLEAVRWLPDQQRQGWHAAGSLWPLQRRVVVGEQREAERRFLGLEVTDDEAGRLNLAEPSVSTVVDHLEDLARHKKGLPVEALVWLDRQQGMEEKERARLRALPWMEAQADDFRPPTHFFRQKHDLAPYRGLLSEDYIQKFPRLMTFMGIKDGPEPSDYVDVIAEISAKLPASGRITAEVADTLRLCLRACLQEWSKSDRQEEPHWLPQLRKLRAIPVGVEGDLCACLPQSALFNDLPGVDIERYGLGDALRFCALSIGSNTFLKALGARGLRSVMDKQLLSDGSRGTPSAYTGHLHQILPGLVRYMHHLRDRRTPESWEEEIASWRFVALPVIESQVSFPSFPMLRPRFVQLEFEILKPDKTILLTTGCSEFIPGAGLRRALGVENATALPGLFKESARGVEDNLNALDIPVLPESFKPRTPPEVTSYRPTALGQSAANLKQQESTSPQTGELTTSGVTDQSSLPKSQASEGKQQKPRPSPGHEQPSLSGSPPPSKPPAGGKAPPSDGDVRQSIQESGRRAAALKDRSPETKPAHAPRPGGGGFKKKPTQRNSGGRLRFRNFVHVSPEGQAESSPSEHNRKVDAIGMQFVKQFEHLAGREVRDDSAEVEGGYDLWSEGADGVRLIEIKTMSGEWTSAGVTVSRKQMHTAFQRDERFWLYVVEHAFTQPRLWCLRNPAWIATSYTFSRDWADEKYAEGPFFYAAEQ